MNDINNLFAALPDDPGREHFTDLLCRDGLRIERIVSFGQTSPESGWYDQDEHEWVVVLQGKAKLAFDDGSEITLARGDHVDIAAHRRHRVAWTDPQQATIWLAVFYR